MKILVAEDNVDVRQALAMQLEARGHEVIQATDGRDACRQFTDDLALIITDFQMPRMDGVGLARVAAAVPIPLVMMSGNPALAAKALAEQGVDHGPLLWKPFDFEALCTAARAVGVNLNGKAA